MEPRDTVIPFSQKSARQRDRAGSTAAKRDSSTVAAVREKVRDHLQERLQRLFARVDDSLFAVAERTQESSEQESLFRGLRLLRVQQEPVAARFSENLDEVFELRPVIAHERDSAAGNGLALVEDDELEQLVVVDSMVANAERDFSAPLSELCLRMDTLYATKVYGKNLPMGPHALVDVFVEAVRPLDLSNQARLILLKKFGQEVIQGLGGLYESCNQLLIDRGVVPDLQTLRNPVKESPQQKTAGTGAQNPAGEAQGGQSYGGQGHGTGAQVSAGQAAPPGSRQVAPGSHAPGLAPADSGVPPMPPTVLLMHLGNLKGMVPHADAGGELAPLNVIALLQKTLEESNEAASLSKSDRDVIKLVEMLFSFIVEDRNLSEPIKRLLGTLQLPLLKLAILDKSFFSKSGHPARKLLNALADAATGWQADERYEEDPLYREIDRVVSRIQGEYDQDVSLFERLLGEFHLFAEEQRRRAVIREKRIVGAADGRARAKAARARVGAVLSALTEGRELPPVIHDWLEKVWRHALFLTCVDAGTDSEAWSSDVRTVRDLVWSVQAPMPACMRQLQALLPSLQSRLRETIEVVSLNPHEARGLFAGLKEIYQQRFEQARAELAAQKEADSESTGQDGVEAAPGDGIEGEAAEQLPEMEELEQAAEDASVADEPQQAESLEPLAEDDPHWKKTFHMASGSWFELQRSEGERFRCRLAAVIADIGQFIFVNRNGAQVAQFSRLELAHALRRSQLVPLDDGMLFERALQSVIGSTRRNRASQ